MSYGYLLIFLCVHSLSIDVEVLNSEEKSFWLSISCLTNMGGANVQGRKRRKETALKCVQNPAGSHPPRPQKTISTQRGPL